MSSDHEKVFCLSSFVPFVPSWLNSSCPDLWSSPIIAGRTDKTRILIPPPLWALAVMAFIGLIDPLSHAIIRHFPPAGATPTGGHTVDTIFYLAGMKHAHPPWTSPYTLCGEPYTEGDLSLFAIPFHHLFGAVGTIGDWLRIEPFYMIALANGACAAFYLYAVYCFLVLVVPRLAGRAFLLFSLGGGLGGLLYLLTGPWHSHPDFGVYFQRYFMYELNEGARFQPCLMAARLYYTLPFGLAFLGLAAFWRGLDSGRRVDGIAATVLLALPAFINMRLGPMFWMVLVILACCHPVASWRRCIAWTGVALIGTGIGLGASAWMISWNPQLVENVARSQRTALWFSPIVSATFFYWLLIPGALLRSANSAKGIFRYAAWAALGYVAAFTALYVAYQLYYGNFLRTGEFHVAVKISDWALLLCAPLGLVVAWWKGGKPQVATDAEAPPWAALWLLLFFALSISAWGQGWFLKFTPDRFAIMIGVPLAILGAAAIEWGVLRWPKLYRGLQAAIIVCGVISIGVTWLVSYGPLGYRTLQEHYPWTRFAFMNQADADTLAYMEEGVVLAPSDGAPIIGDVAVLRGNSTVFGIGIQDYARHEGPALRGVVAEFFHPDTPDAWRKTKAEEWCVRYVYCPDTDPVNPDTVAQLRACGWLEEVAANGDAVLFEVDDEPSNREEIEMGEKTFFIPGTQIKDLVEPMGYCFATDRVVVDGKGIGYMYREPPDQEGDSGWRFFHGDESQEYTDDASKTGLYAVNTLANYDPDIIPYLDTEAPCAFEKVEGGAGYRRVEN